MFVQLRRSLVGLALCLSLLTACSQNSAPHLPTATTNATPSERSASEQSSRYPVTLSMYDDEGKQIRQTLEKAPERVVVVGQGFAELMLAFGAEDKIVGVGYLDKSYSKYEAQIAELPILAEMWPSPEAILELKPDLIVAMSSGFKKDRIGNIAFWNERKIPVLAGINYTIGRTIDGFFDDIANLGAVLNIEAKADVFIAEQRQRMAAIQKIAEHADVKPKVLLVASGGRETYDYYSPTLCVIDEMIEGSGGEYLKLSEDTYVEMSAESILSVNPDKIILTEFQRSDSEAARNKLLNNPTLRSVTAIKNGDVMVADYTNAIRGSLELADLYEDVATFLHPDLFGGKP